MSFNQDPGHHGGLPRLPKTALAYIGAGIIALGVTGEAIYAVVSTVNSDITGVGHDIAKGVAALKPGQESLIEAQEALNDVSLPSYLPVVSGDVTGTGTIESFKTFPVFGGRVPGTTDHVSLTMNGSAQILASKNAIVSEKVDELPGSTGNNPRLGATIKVNVDDLYTSMLELPAGNGPVQSRGNGDGLLPKVGHVFIGNSPDAKYTALLTNVENNYLAIKCGQAMAPLVQAEFQNNFYEQAGRTPLPPGQSPEIQRYLNAISDRTLPVVVDLVDSQGRPVDPQTFQLRDASELMTKKQIAKRAGVSTDDLNVNLSSPCESKPLAVRQQIAISESYVSHSGQAASVNVSYGG